MNCEVEARRCLGFWSVMDENSFNGNISKN
jgi:hypothetical protein